MGSDHHWQVLLLKGPQKILRKLPTDLQSRLISTLHGLEDEPYPNGVKKLSGYENYFRIRVGDWRIIYAVEEERLIILVLEIGAWGGVYKD